MSTAPARAPCAVLEAAPPAAGIDARHLRELARFLPRGARSRPHGAKASTRSTRPDRQTRDTWPDSSPAGCRAARWCRTSATPGRREGLPRRAWSVSFTRSTGGSKPWCSGGRPWCWPRRQVFATAWSRLSVRCSTPSAWRSSTGSTPTTSPRQPRGRPEPRSASCRSCTPGTLYAGRDPGPFLVAIGEMLAEGALARRSVKVDFYGPVEIDTASAPGDDR